MDLKNLSSNWKKLQASGNLEKPAITQSSLPQKEKATQKPQHQNGSLKRKRSEAAKSSQQKARVKHTKKLGEMSEQEVNAKNSIVPTGYSNSIKAIDGSQTTGDRINEGLAKNVDVGKYLALDCEMVGVGPHPHLESALARISLVNYNGEQVYDSYVKPQEQVTDWRTHVSGIQPKHMVHARSFEEVQADVASLIKSRIVVGHSVRGDFDVLFLDHPKKDIRDTARHPPFRKLAGGGSPKLKILASELLGLDIQIGEHSSVEDARATMLLFRRDKEAFEREHVKKWGMPMAVKKVDAEAAADDTRKTPKKRKKKRKK